jgi:hypothetical protein
MRSHAAAQSKYILAPPSVKPNLGNLSYLIQPAAYWTASDESK